jgi:conjugative relaxase-like TrwC/TraI family protein
MIRMIQSSSAGHAKTYYTEALLKSDYYIGGQELNGTFRGALSTRLGITGPATRERFHALCENRHPETDKPLTPRTKKDRTVGYDINFHVPKSVSILHALAKDDHVLDAFQASVNQTMKDIEADARARIRKNGRYADRITGELLWVDFIHQTARPVEGYAPDPHLHAHCYVFNMTWDQEEQRLKACQFRQINTDMPYYQSMFHKRLSDNLIACGYRVRQTGTSFEVESVPQEVIDLFSKRTDAIGRIAKEKGITDAKELSELGARSRAKKQQGLSMAELRAEWRNQIRASQPADRMAGDAPVRFAPFKEKRPLQRDLSLEQCLDYTFSHSFVRASVMPFNKLAGAALKYSMGSSLAPEDIISGLQHDSRLVRIKEKNSVLCTTREVLREEERMVRLAQDGKGSFVPLYGVAPAVKAVGQQGDAIRHVLTTHDMVSIVRGAAGAGKTTLMTEAVRLIEDAGKTVTVISPTSRNARGNLKNEGFTDAQTVALFLMDKKHQEAVKGQVIWVDEAGMLGTEDMAALLEVATMQKARLILGGDTRQHASVKRGDALRILNTVGGIRTAEVNKIYRQKGEVYRSAVADLSKGNIRDGFEKLDSIGAIRETDPQNTYTPLVNDYMKAVKAGKSVLVVSPTHHQGDKVTEALRERLKQSGLIGKKEITVAKYKSLGLTDAQKTDWRHYREGQIIQFNQNRKGIKRGSAWEVAAASEQDVVIKNKQGETQRLSLERTDQFDLFNLSNIPVAKGDKIQITKNSFDKDKHRLNNGDVFDVLSVSKKGDVVLFNKVSKAIYNIDKDFGNVALAHCVTSHASQGATVDEIFIAQHSATFPATDAKQFYVSVSRARENVSIYTDDKEMLLYRASETGDRRSAMELVKGKLTHEDHIMQRQHEINKMQELAKQQDPVKDHTPDHSLNLRTDPKQYYQKLLSINF